MSSHAFLRPVTAGTGNWGWVFAWPVMAGTGDNGLIKVVQNTGQNMVKIPFHITVNDIVYNLCIKALKNSLTRLKVTATITWFQLRKIEDRKGLTKQ